eukprot:m.18058 g.18058  ORF g.18058 m.18058 type:complete len:576 (-) comp11374_c0_seq1:341-2068(-)
MGKPGGNARGGGGGRKEKKVYATPKKLTKKDKASLKPQTKLQLDAAAGHLDQSLKAYAAGNTAAARQSIAKAEEDYSKILENHGGTHLDARYNLGMCHYQKADIEESIQSWRSMQDELQAARMHLERAIADDTSRRGETTGLAHATLASVLVRIADFDTSDGKKGLSLRERLDLHRAAADHLTRALEIHQIQGDGSGAHNGALRVQAGDNQASIMKLQIEAHAAVVDVKASCERACELYGVNVSTGVYVFHGDDTVSDADALLQKLKVLHGFASWALDDDVPASRFLSLADIKPFLDEGRACARALSMLLPSTDSPGHHMHDPQDASGGHEACCGGAAAGGGEEHPGSALSTEADAERLVMSGDLCQFHARAYGNAPTRMPRHVGGAAADTDVAVTPIDEALGYYRAATQTAPTVADAHASLGEMLYEAAKGCVAGTVVGGDPRMLLEQAIHAYDRALALQPTDAVSAYNAVCVVALLGADVVERVGAAAVDRAVNATVIAEKARASAEGGRANVDGVLRALADDIRDDEDLKVMHDLPWFQERLAQSIAEAKGRKDTVGGLVDNLADVMRIESA